MTESKKGNNSINFSWNSLKRLSGNLNIDLNLYAKYQNPSSWGSQDFSIVIMVESKKGHNLVNISQNSLIS